LIVAATRAEIEPLLAQLHFKEGGNKYKSHQIFIVITGVGMVATAFALGQHLAANQYDVALNWGIAGAFDKKFKVGELVNISSDRFAELGAEDGEEFISLDDLGLGSQLAVPQAAFNDPALGALKTAEAITVNKVHGDEKSISTTIERLSPQTESMEGAAFFYACNQVGVPCAQVRAISNYVERRNRDGWNIGLAIKNLNIFAVEFINNVLSSQSTSS
jgi:futalosine hydrolase